MFDFQATKQRARQQLHDTLSEPAVYIRKSDGRKFNICVRLHRKVESIGGDEGFAQILTDIDRIVFLSEDLEHIDPSTGDTVNLPNQKVTAVIETVEPASLPTQICNVTLE